MGVDPRSLGIKALSSHLGMEDRRAIEEVWGAPCYDMYGTNEAGMIACDCSHQQGLHLQEDATLVEIVDPETGQEVAEGERGTILLTTLFKHFAPQIRFNVNDVSAFVPGPCPCGGTHRRIERIFGRSDNMVKLRGINVFPEAIGALVGEDRRSTGEYFCIIDHVGPNRREEMTVLVETLEASVDKSDLAESLERRLHEALGVKVTAKPMDPGALDAFTGASQTSKIKRLLDNRKKH
jgi:phenylacetate-CoA ligase